VSIQQAFSIQNISHFGNITGPQSWEFFLYSAQITKYKNIFEQSTDRVLSQTRGNNKLINISYKNGAS
jgi:hypothetical protein